MSRTQRGDEQGLAFDSVPRFLQEALEQRELLIFAGAGISRSHRGEHGFPTAAELAASIQGELLGRPLAESSPGNLMQLSQEAVWLDGSRHRLNSLLRKTFASSQVAPKPAHVAIATLAVPVITTNYDNLIERASLEVGTPLPAVWRDSQLSNSNNAFVIKVHGSIEEPETCVICEDDYHDWLERDPDLRNLVRALLVTRTVCFVGYSLGDPNFRALLRALAMKFGQFRRPSVLISHRVDTASYDYRYITRSLGLTVIEADATEFLETLVSLSAGGPYLDVESSPVVRRSYFSSNTATPYVEHCADFVIDAITKGTSQAHSFGQDVFAVVRSRSSHLELDPAPLIRDGYAFVGAGAFIAGGQRHGNEIIRLAQVSAPFWMAVHPVTHAEYAEFLECINDTAHPAPFCHPDEPPGKSHEPGPDSNGTALDFDWRSQALARRPIVYVDWWDAYAYARWSGARLPLDIEWERAARGRLGRTYPWGDEFDPTLVNTLESGRGTSLDVDELPGGASPVGAIQMAGNVWEWCADVYFGADWTPSAAHVVRGGSFTRGEERARSAFRSGRAPGERWVSRGFRIVRDAEAKSATSE